MILNTILNKNIYRLISFLEIVLGLILLILKINDICSLIKSINNIPKEFQMLISFVPIECGDILLGSILLLAGISYWINKKIFWALSLVSLVLFLLKFILFLVYDLSLIPIIVFILAVCCFLLLVKIGIKIKLLKVEHIESTIINSRTKILTGVISFICCFIYWDINYGFIYHHILIPAIYY